MREFLFYPLLEVSEDNLELTLAPVNLLLIAAVIVSAFFGLKLARRSLLRIADKSALIEKKGSTLFKLTKQLTYVVSAILLIQSFNINNDHINFAAFLETKLIQIDKFEIDIYHILLAILLFFITKVILNLFKLYLHRNLSKRDWVDEGKEFTIYQLVRYFTYTIVIIILVRSTGVQMSLLLTSAAALFVGVGLGLQTIFADIVSGFIMLFDGSVKVGDTLEFGDEVVQVKKINIRTTLVETLDNSIRVIPNSQLTTNIVENRNNRNKLSRYGVTVSVAYGTDTTLVKDLLLEAASEHRNISTTKRPRVFFQNFGNDGLEFELYFWTSKDMLNVRIKSDLRFEIDRLFREHDITVPFPQRTLHLHPDNKELIRSILQDDNDGKGSFDR